MTALEKIQSLQSNMGVAYKRPSPERLKEFREALKRTGLALKYLQDERNLTQTTIDYFQLGYDAQRHAIVIPVFKRGELINLRYRFIDPNKKPKYIQEKDAEVWLYHEEGIKIGTEKKGVLIVEGEFDLMSCYQAGFTNVVSPASGKDSYGPWIEHIDAIKRVYICYDNDAPGKEAAQKLSERLGPEKCFEVLYPGDVKDANDYFKTKTSDDFKTLIRNARPFYTYQFQGLQDIINDLRFNKKETISVEHLPDVKIGPDWLIVVSGETNIGKTSYMLNITEELMEKKIPTLILPFERGPQVVGTRYLQVKYNFSEGDFQAIKEEDWEKMQSECIETPLYFAMPTKDETIDIIKKAKRIFNTKVVIIDHLDYMIRSTQNLSAEIANTLQDLKRVAEEQQIIMFVVTHIRKIHAPGSMKKKEPNLDDLKNSSSLKQDPECVVMLTKPEEGFVKVKILKNKGKMSDREYPFNVDTGKIGKHIGSQVEDAFKDFTNTDDKEI